MKFAFIVSIVAVTALALLGSLIDGFSVVVGPGVLIVLCVAAYCAFREWKNEQAGAEYRHKKDVYELLFSIAKNYTSEIYPIFKDCIEKAVNISETENYRMLVDFRCSISCYDDADTIKTEFEKVKPALERELRVAYSQYMRR